MNKELFIEVIENTFRAMLQLTATKGEEYTGGKEAGQFDNFKRWAQRSGLTVGQAWSVVFGKHLDAVDTFIRDDANGTGRARSEPIEGRIHDLILYLLLLKAMVQNGDVGRLLDEVQTEPAPPVEPVSPRPTPISQGHPFAKPDRGVTVQRTHSEVEFSRNPPVERKTHSLSREGKPSFDVYTLTTSEPVLIDLSHPAPTLSSDGQLSDHLSRLSGKPVTASQTAISVAGEPKLARALCAYLGLIPSAALASAGFTPKSGGGLIVYVQAACDVGDLFTRKRIGETGWAPSDHLEYAIAAKDHGHEFLGLGLVVENLGQVNFSDRSGGFIGLDYTDPALSIIVRSVVTFQ